MVGAEMANWSENELRSTVRAYLQMRDLQDKGVAYSKAQFRRDLLKGPLKTRNDSSIEFRMRNISAVLSMHGQPLLKGYVPAKNVGKAVAGRLWGIVSGEQALSTRQPPIIYFNIGWMKRYAGATPDDQTLGGMGYLAEHKHGAESFNFLPHKD